ncbi:MAG: hypothetical protein GWN29_05550 [Gammaproteobacteria bacterium]|nr:hypothetical protein [Gammaproteobacteria bacterium]
MHANAKITEQYTRRGDVLTLEMTVDDPAFIRPWVLRPIERRPSPNPSALLPPTPVCLELAADSISGERFRQR